MRIFLIHALILQVCLWWEKIFMLVWDIVQVWYQVSTDENLFIHALILQVCLWWATFLMSVLSWYELSTNENLFIHALILQVVCYEKYSLCWYEISYKYQYELCTDKNLFDSLILQVYLFWETFFMSVLWDIIQALVWGMHKCIFLNVRTYMCVILEICMSLQHLYMHVLCVWTHVYIHRHPHTQKHTHNTHKKYTKWCEHFPSSFYMSESMDQPTGCHINIILRFPQLLLTLALL